MQIGDTVTFVTPTSEEHDALVTAVWDGGDKTMLTPSLNVCYVSGDLAKTDQYGRQIERATSVVHESNQHAHGNYWRPMLVVRQLGE